MDFTFTCLGRWFWKKICGDPSPGFIGIGEDYAGNSGAKLFRNKEQPKGSFVGLSVKFKKSSRILSWPATCGWQRI
jgi:hypothetical protein